MVVQRLENPSEADLEQAGRCWAEGIFPTNPLSRRMVGNSIDNARKRAIGIIRREESYVACGPDADQHDPSSIAGVLVFQRPKGHRPIVKQDDTAVNGTLPNRALGVVIPPADQEWLNTTMREWWTGFSASSFGPKGNDERLYVTVLSVLPECQNQGLGREMMDVVVGLADEHGWEASLATSGDEDHIAPLLRFYGRYGFEVVGHSDLDSGTEGLCRTWALIRPSKGKQAPP